MNEDNDKASLKKFFIKLIAITFSIIIIINITYNLIFAEKFESINKLLDDGVELPQFEKALEIATKIKKQIQR